MPPHLTFIGTHLLYPTRGLYEVGQSSDLFAKVNELSCKLDSFLSLGQVPPYFPHPNFSWSQPNHGQPLAPLMPPYLNTSNLHAYNLAPAQQPYQQPSPLPSTQRTPSLEEQVLQTMGELKVDLQLLHSHSQSIAKLEIQVGQIVNALNCREDNKLPSQPIANPKEVHQIDSLPADPQANIVLNLRNGRDVETRLEEETCNKKGSESEQILNGKEINPHVTPTSIPPAEPSYVPKVPFPTCLNAPSPFRKKGAEQEDMMEVFKQVKINLPLLEAIKQVPSYAKFLRDLCTQKRKSKTHEPKNVRLTEQVSSILTRNIPIKRKDPGVPIISCVIGDHVIDRALLDLGASVNLLPYSVYEQLGLGELKPTPVTLQLADRSTKVPRGMIEDVLVKVDKFYFPVDFIVLDMEPVHNPNK